MPLPGKKQFPTITAMFQEQSARYAPKVCMQRKLTGKYEPVLWSEVSRMVEETATGLLAEGVAFGDRVAILSKTRLEWAVADLAILAVGGVTVPVYDTLTPAQIEFILKDSGAQVIFVSDQTQLVKVLEIAPSAGLRRIVVFEELPEECESGPVVCLAEFWRSHRESDLQAELAQRRAAVEPQHLASLVYTSGTTGNPKGVMLTHGNFMASINAALENLPVSETDVSLSFLPLSHVFERMAGHFLMLTAGACISYAESIDTIAANLQEVRPTIMTAVPRVYEKVYARVQARIEGGTPLRKKLFAWAVGVGTEYMTLRDSGQPIPWKLDVQFALADKIIFSKVRGNLGGRVRYFSSGGAPLADEIIRFFYALGIHILEGYGLTETAPVLTSNTPVSFKFNSVGKAIPNVELRIAEDGEILARGPNIMQGYWNRPDATAEAIDADGWFHTGDIGELDADGFLRITDRKKEIIVMSNGKNVAPQLLENALKINKYIGMAMAVGDNRKFITGIICPDFETLEPWAKQQGLKYGSRAELVQLPAVRAHYDEQIRQSLHDFARYEHIRKYVLLDREFEQDRDELTPSLKLKRRNILNAFAEQVEALYAAGDGHPGEHE